MRDEPIWVPLNVVLAIHEAQLAEHGGASGIRDPGLLESALARPKNRFAYSDSATLFDLAAAYAVALAKHHAFIDGNKRTAWLVCYVFLERNGLGVNAKQAEVVTTMIGVAAGTIDEQDLAQWLVTIVS